jgi:phosphoribosylformylglycinamidine cyclo-ligase
MKLCILVSGHGTTMDAIADAIDSGQIPARIALVVSDRPGIPALEKAARRGLPTVVVQPPPKGTEDWQKTLAAHMKASGCDLVVLAGYLRVLRDPVLDAFQGRIINLHPALLPKFGGPGMYGTRVHAAVLESGDKITGSTVHLVTKDVDRGPIIMQRSMEVRAGETPDQLSDRQRPLEHALMIEVIASFARGKLPLPWQKGPVTYAASGVDYSEIRKGVSALVSSVRYRPPPSRGKLEGGIGHYAGIVKVGKMMLALTTDGVGTKVLIAEDLGRWEEVGEDMVAVNVNDLLAAGATSSAMVDYVACRQPDRKVLSAIGRGLNRGLEKGRCALIGGETAVVPEMLNSAFDLSGTALGFYPEGYKPITGEGLKPGDVLIGLTSSGFHSNGYTLVRRLVQDNRLSLSDRIPGEPLPLGRALLRPARIYVPTVEPLVKERTPVALAHVTGGGLRNLVRLNKDVQFVLDGLPEPEGLFAWVAELSKLSAEELYSTFNMGIGFIIGVRPKDENRALATLKRSGEKGARVVGHVERGKGVSLPREGVRYTSY